MDTFDLMGAQFDRLRYEVFQNLFLSPMNTDLLRHAVATAPTVYGIETYNFYPFDVTIEKLQQHLPFTVLKPISELFTTSPFKNSCNSTYRLRY